MGALVSVRIPDKAVIIFVARQNLHLTKKAIRSALSQDAPCDAVLVDNASTDGTAQWAATKPIAVIALGEQRSLSACWNLGLKGAWKSGATAALVCNTDVELRPDCARLLLEQGGPFVTCVSVSSEDQMGVPGDRSVKELRLTERPHPDFSCFLIRKEVTDDIGWFNEDYFPAYAEDAEFHIRLHRAGIGAVCVDLPFLHHGASTLKNASEGELRRIRRGGDANRLRFKQAYGCLPGSPEYYAMFGATVPDHPM